MGYPSKATPADRRLKRNKTQATKPAAAGRARTGDTGGAAGAGFPRPAASPKAPASRRPPAGQKATSGVKPPTRAKSSQQPKIGKAGK